MCLNDAMCTLLHLGCNNLQNSYYIEQIQINAIESYKDLEVTISEDLNGKLHIAQIVKKTNTLIYSIQKAFREYSKEMIVKLHKYFVRQKIEYMHTLERVQP